MLKKTHFQFDDFSKLNYQQRIDKLISMGLLTSEEMNSLSTKKPFDYSIADKLIENAISYFPMPLGIAVNFIIDNQDYVIPMAVEETSVIAAASKTAKWIKQNGIIFTENLGCLAIGQIQFAKIRNYKKFKSTIELHKNELISLANNGIAKNLVNRGGGVKDIIVRGINRGDGLMMGVLHVMIETCNAMGANIINQICEFLKNPVQDITKEKVHMCILSNLVDTKLSQAKVVIYNIDPQLGKSIEEASLFAQLDPYRAATNNKGILNAIDAIALATGNDWRAIEAGIHAYAAQSGQYRSLSTWKMIKNDLIGVLKAPINVGIVGGITNAHPTAKLCLKMLGVNTASELARIIAAVGLVQNLGALRALCTEGITKGHMRLHITNLCIAAGADDKEINLLKNQLEKCLSKNKHISVSDSKVLLDKLRREKREKEK